MGLGGVGLLELHLDFTENEFLLSVINPRFAADSIKIEWVYSLDNNHYLVLTM